MPTPFKQLVNYLHLVKDMVWCRDKEATYVRDTRGLQMELPRLPSYGRSGESIHEEDTSKIVSQYPELEQKRIYKNMKES